MVLWIWMMCKSVCFKWSVIKTLKRELWLKCLRKEGDKVGNREGGERRNHIIEFSYGKWHTSGPQMLLNNLASQNHLKALLKNRWLGPLLEFLNQWSGMELKIAVLASSQVMLLMLIPRPQSENHWRMSTHPQLLKTIIVRCWDIVLNLLNNIFPLKSVDLFTLNVMWLKRWIKLSTSFPF